MIKTLQRVPTEAQEGIRAPGAGVTGGWELPDMDGYWEPNLDLVEEQQVFFTQEPSLQPLIYCLDDTQNWPFLEGSINKCSE